MQSWSRPDVPHVPSTPADSAIPFFAFDTSAQKLTDVTPSQPEARLYVCGITPYDATHMGHAATYVAFDLVQRQWLDQGFDVHFVQNVTDVDDPLLERATATGQNWEELAVSETNLFREDMTALRVLPPRHYIGAVESIPLVIDRIEKLREAGAVYLVGDDLYFSVNSDPNFGAVSHYSSDQMVTLCRERGGDPDREGKHAPMDCLLWQAERPGEPSWPSPFGAGRPGWHIECAAIANEYLGRTFDIQGGGSDLIFPHHEMSASQAAVETGEPFAQHFLHTGMVGYDGEKMSKSKGNLVLVSALRTGGHDPMAIRLALLAHHYRADWEWFDSDLDAATVRLERWSHAFARTAAPSPTRAISALRNALRNDLDAPGSLDIVDQWCAETGDSPQAGAAMRDAVDALLGVRL